MLASFIWFITFYFLYKFIFDFVIPAVTATRHVQAKMKDMNQKTNSFSADPHSSNIKKESFSNQHSNQSSPKGDYIDFEEIK